MITDHAYDSGPVNTGAPCIADPGIGYRNQHCGKHEHEHKYSEYVDVTAGSMHEPDPYRHELDWPDMLAHPFED